MRSPFQRLASLTYERFAMDALVGAESRFLLDLDSDFPLMIKFRDYDGHRMPHPLSWHRALEMFVSTAGGGALQIGERLVEFAEGDLIVVDGLKLHGLVRYQGRRRRGIAVLFASDLVYRVGSPLSDLVFLSPFHLADGLKVSLLRGAGSRELADSLNRLIGSYLKPGACRHPRVQSKVHLLHLLYLLSERVQPRPDAEADYRRRQGEIAFLDRLHAYLVTDLSNRTTVNDAAAIMGMSRFAFMRSFKRVTGVNFVAYFRGLRLDKAVSLLRETSLSIAEVSAAVGFTDQSYFDRLFRARYQCTPKAFRSGACAGIDLPTVSC